MRSYHAPALQPVGSVIELTMGAAMGGDDGGGTQQLVAPGSTGFNL